MKWFYLIVFISQIRTENKIWLIARPYSNLALRWQPVCLALSNKEPWHLPQQFFFPDKCTYFLLHFLLISVINKWNKTSIYMIKNIFKNIICKLTNGCEVAAVFICYRKTLWDYFINLSSWTFFTTSVISWKTLS